MLLGEGHKGNKFANPSVGKNNIQLPLHLGNGLVKTIKVGQVGDISLNARKVGADRLPGLVKFLRATARDEHICTLFDEKLCRSQSNPFCAACDDSNLTFESFRHCFPVFLPSSDGRRATSEYSRRYPRRTYCKDHAIRIRYAASRVRCRGSGRGETQAAAQCRIRRSPRARFACTSTPPPTRATCDPPRASPRTPRVFPRRSVPTVCCQPPDRTELLSVTICRAEAKISAQVNSIVGSDLYPV